MKQKNRKRRMQFIMHILLLLLLVNLQNIVTVKSIDISSDTFLKIDSESWYQIDLVIYDYLGNTKIEINLLRPLSWIEQTKTEAGNTIILSIPEKGIINETAYVLDIKSFPDFSPGKGNPVTGLFRSFGKVLKFTFESGEFFECTYGHRFFSMDQNDWIPACELHEGDQILAMDDYVTIVSIEPQDGVHEVFNLEVAKDHTYCVTNDNIVSHNENPCANTNEGVSRVLSTKHEDLYLSDHTIDQILDRSLTTDNVLEAFKNARNVLWKKSSKILFQGDHVELVLKNAGRRSYKVKTVYQKEFKIYSFDFPAGEISDEQLKLVSVGGAPAIPYKGPFTTLDTGGQFSIRIGGDFGESKVYGLVKLQGVKRGEILSTILVAEREVHKTKWASQMRHHSLNVDISGLSWINRMKARSILRYRGYEIEPLGDIYKIWGSGPLIDYPQ